MSSDSSTCNLSGQRLDVADDAGTKDACKSCGASQVLQHPPMHDILQRYSAEQPPPLTCLWESILVTSFL